MNNQFVGTILSSNLFYIYSIKNLKEYLMDNYAYLLIIFWLFSLWAIWKSKKRFSKNFETQGKLFISYFLVSLWILIFTIGHVILSHEIRMHLLSEILGICITVLLVERVYSYIKKRDELFYQRLMLRSCKMPIYAYFRLWFIIYQAEERNPIVIISKFKSLEEFLLSDEFYNCIFKFNFNSQQHDEKMYAKFFYERINEIGDRFQNILTKYGSKLAFNDIKLIEHFGGSAFMFSIFAIMNGLCDVNTPFLNSLQKVHRKHLNEHFKKFVELVNDYNSSFENTNQHWTLSSLILLDTIESANTNSNIEW